MVKTIEQVLEEFKQQGNYGVVLFYGEDVGCDDKEVPVEKRCVKLLGNPVGCLGETRLVYFGDVESLKGFDFNNKPMIVSNPPKSDELKYPGYYIYGTKSGVETIMKLRGWEE